MQAKHTVANRCPLFAGTFLIPYPYPLFLPSLTPAMLTCIYMYTDIAQEVVNTKVFLFIIVAATQQNEDKKIVRSRTFTCPSVTIQPKSIIALTRVRPSTVDTKMLTVIGRRGIALIDIWIRLIESKQIWQKEVPLTVTFVSVNIESVALIAAARVIPKCIVADLATIAGPLHTFIDI